MADVDTIVAIATAAGRGGIGVVRVSGPAAGGMAQTILGRSLPARAACLAQFRDASGVAIDRGIAIFFPGPASYTGEDVLELQGHGGPVVLSLVLQRCIELGARLAEPGEFTRRALLNDKLDLAQAEAVADLIDAATTRAARSAARSLQGEFSGVVAALQQELIDVRVLVEASFDFPEDEVDVLGDGGALEKLTSLSARVRQVLASAVTGRLLRDGVEVALVGPPNVGKSSLINALSETEVAIVTPVPGTTRDVLRASVALQGIPFHLVDTAGMRVTEDPVEVIGVERARSVARAADVVVRISDASASFAEPDVETAGRVVHVHNKIDLVGLTQRRELIAGAEHVWISARHGWGLDLLAQVLVETVGAEGGAGEGTFSARQRHLDALRRAAAHIGNAMRSLVTPEFAAEELRLAQENLSQLTGEYLSDDLLGEIFARFCIGK